MKQGFLVWLYVLFSSTLMLAIDNAVNSCYLLITHYINFAWPIFLNHVNTKGHSTFWDNKFVIYFSLKMSWLLFPQKQQLLWLHVKIPSPQIVPIKTYVLCWTWSHWADFLSHATTILIQMVVTYTKLNFCSVQGKYNLITYDLFFRFSRNVSELQLHKPAFLCNERLP